MNDLRPFRFWCQKVLPLVYDDSLSYYELLCKVVDYLNKTMENVNSLNENFDELQQMFNTLKQYVDDYFKNLDVQEEINNKLDEMAKNGEFELLLQNATTKNRIYNLEFLGRTFSNDEYKSAQAMCCVTINNTLHIYTCFYNYNTENEKSIIVDMLIDGTIIRKSEPLSMSHSNDMCYNSITNKFLICGYGKDKVYEINYDDLTLNTIYTLPTNIISITFDNKNNKYYTYIDRTIREYNYDFTKTSIVSQGEFIESYGVETIEYKNNLLYIIQNQPNSITTLSTHDWKIKTVGMLQDYASDYYPIGEVQAISIYNDNGDFILNGKPRQYNVDTESTEVGEGITVYCKGNVYTNLTYTRRYTQASITPFVSKATIGNKLVFKPLGTTDEPFYTFSEISLCLNAPLYTPNTININKDLSNEDISLINCNVSIQGNGHTINSASIFNYNGYINDIICNTNFHITRMNGVINSIKCDNIIVEQSNIGIIEIDKNKIQLNNTIINKITYNDILLNVNNTTDTTYDINNINKYETLTILMINTANGRILDIKTIPTSVANTALYFYSCDGLTTSANIYRNVIIFNSATSITIAGNEATFKIIGN